MTLSITRQFLRAGATALILSTVTSVSMFVSADAVYAERGGNANSNGRANRDSERGNRDSERGNRDSERGNRGQDRQNARQEIMESAGVSNWGAIASELGELNKANANINARLNSSDPIHQALGVYETSGGISVAGISAYNTALGDYATLQETIDTQATDEFGEPLFQADGVTSVLITAEDIGIETEEDYLASLLSPGLIAAYESLAVLNGYRDDPLTSGAMDALNYMLDLAAPADS
jgi:hypothetical protein